jgi:hypothetical protein
MLAESFSNFGRLCAAGRKGGSFLRLEHTPVVLIQDTVMARLLRKYYCVCV